MTPDSTPEGLPTTEAGRHHTARLVPLINDRDIYHIGEAFAEAEQEATAPIRSQIAALDLIIADEPCEAVPLDGEDGESCLTLESPAPCARCRIAAVLADPAKAASEWRAKVAADAVAQERERLRPLLDVANQALTPNGSHRTFDGYCPDCGGGCLVGWPRPEVPFVGPNPFALLTPEVPAAQEGTKR